MGKNLEKLIFNKKPENWQEDCVNKSAQKISDEFTGQFKSEEFRGTAQKDDKNLLSRNIASIFAESVDACKLAGENRFREWVKTKKTINDNAYGFKQPKKFGGLRQFLWVVTQGKSGGQFDLIPINQVNQSLAKNKDFLKNLNFDKRIIDLEKIKQDWFNNQKTAQKKAKYWTENARIISNQKVLDILERL